MNKKKVLLGLMGNSALALFAAACSTAGPSDAEESIDVFNPGLSLQELSKTNWACSTTCFEGASISYSSCSTNSSDSAKDADAACKARDGGGNFGVANDAKTTCKTTGQKC